MICELLCIVVNVIVVVIIKNEKLKECFMDLGVDWIFVIYFKFYVEEMGFDGVVF